MRYEHISPDGRYELAWGFDHACGWFVQVFDSQAEDPEEPIVDEDTVFNETATGDIILVANTYGLGETVRNIMYDS